MLKNLTIHESWNNFLDEQGAELIKISKQIGDSYTPKKDQVLRFLELDLAKVKVVWLGMDVYNQVDANTGECTATGRSFEVNGYTDWLNKVPNTSLSNIVKLIHKTYRGDLVGIEKLRENIKDDKFKILPPNEWFNDLEKQGVLFLNTAFTCKPGVSGSHIEIWKSFSIELLKYISQNNPHIHWFLWGKDAESFKIHLNYDSEKQLHISKHPRLNGTNEGDFLASMCFKETSRFINWLGSSTSTRG